MPRHRPTSYEVSFPDEHVVDVSKVSFRQDDEFEPASKSEANRHSSTAHYVVRGDEWRENIVLKGEDDLRYDFNSRGKKPLRVIQRFLAFDVANSNRLTSFALFEEIGEKTQNSVHVAGFVSSGSGGNADDDALDEDLDEDPQSKDEVLMIIANVENCVLDFSGTLIKPICFETTVARYILSTPAKEYRQLWLEYYQPRRIAQLVMSSVIKNKAMSFRDFLLSFCTRRDPVLGQLTEAHLRDAEAIQKIEQAVMGYNPLLLTSPVLSQILRNRPNQPPSHVYKPLFINPDDAQPTNLNPDDAVLRPEFQNPTHITPHISQLAEGLFEEPFQVVGKRPGSITLAQKVRRERERRLARSQLEKCVERSMMSSKRVVFGGRRERIHNTMYVKSCEVDKEKYEVGDVVVIAGNQMEEDQRPKGPADLSPSATIQDYFWFGQILNIYSATEKFHVQWFWHSSTTAMGELHDPRELYLSMTCDDIDLETVVGKTTVRFLYPQDETPGDDEFGFFCRFAYSEREGSYHDIDLGTRNVTLAKRPPDNCPVCPLRREWDKASEFIKTDNGFKWMRLDYHVGDFIFCCPWNNQEGPCYFGRIESVGGPRDERPIKISYFGRLMSVSPDTEFKDERCLFATTLTFDLEPAEVLGTCFVLDKTEFVRLAHRTQLPPNVFYATHRIRSRAARVSRDEPLQFFWEDRVELGRAEISEWRCSNRFETSCLAKLHKEVDDDRLFGQEPGHVLRTFDPFAGVGAFTSGLSASGCIKLTHAIEIGPSTAKTLMKNSSPDTIIYNTCSNLVLQYSVRKADGISDAKLKRRDTTTGMDTTLNLPPILPGEIDCIVAGFPCQPHSSLNIYRRTEERKTNLMLNLFSWVDFLRPKYCIFENVKGFLSCNLIATQDGKHRTLGGIEGGSFKFLIRTLTSLKYQCRYALLEAGQYGTPQGRVRFFLIAALTGNPLPKLPQPTHYFKSFSGTLTIDIHSGPIRPTNPIGFYTLFPGLTIKDAIGDLQSYSWADPDSTRIPAGEVETSPDLTHWGPRGAPRYLHPPRNTFQEACRKNEDDVEELQHWTRTFLPMVVKRVRAVPVEGNRDYRWLPPSLWEWQGAAPTSANARDRFRPGLYGRLSGDDAFRATVANVAPTAKQCWILHYRDKRIYSVRELARSQGFPDDFHFSSIRASTVTIHRQIANAVPYPVSVAIGRELRITLRNQWLAKEDEDAMDVE